MDTKEASVHEGHRRRMTERLFNNADSMSDHELLEILLYSTIKRKNTNDLAHKLLRNFGSLENLFNADAKSIMVVSGIGEASVRELKTVGQIIKAISSKKKQKPNLFSFANNRQEFVDFFKDEIDEKFVIYLLNEKHFLVSKLVFEDHNRDSVTADIPEIVKAIAINSPSFAIIAHNHPSGKVEPTETDDFTTGKLYLLCNVHGVNLVDHVIVSGENTYSYFISGRIDYIKKYFSFEKLISKNMEEILK